jgi:heme ABC exporter ATP-binding subunit CcmA
MDQPRTTTAPSPFRAATPIEVRGVARLFGAVRALGGIDLRLDTGEFCLLVGPNGAGKSTLLRILATLLRPTVGDVLYDGRLSLEAGADLRARLAYLAHRTQLYGDLTGREALALAAELRGVAEEAVGRWSARVGMGPFQDRPVRTYSRGQTQRVALARTLVGDPSLILLDEPTTGLDPEAVRTLCGILAEQHARGATLVVATHDPQVFAGLATRTVRIEAGRVAADTCAQKAAS